MLAERVAFERVGAMSCLRSSSTRLGFRFLSWQIPARSIASIENGDTNLPLGGICPGRRPLPPSAATL